jgi:Reverse transcriptase (RNA-dependent DNA polymerase)
MEPIRILNELIEDAKEKRSELWIVFQDMSKCYDRVNIYMLEKAMLRLKLPLNFIEIIKNLFSNRKNRVFTAHGLTDPYDIDQGEVISPLLWCIYYDPLLVEIQQRQLGYNLTHSYRQNLYDPSNITSESINVPALAYMDDTNWLSSSKENMDGILTISKEFYSFTNILVNDDKAVLMTTAKLSMLPDPNGILSPTPITFNTGHWSNERGSGRGTS